jgi:hypothetical protein
MSVASTNLVSTKKGKLMAKPRMNKEEKLFMERITALISKHPEIRGGVRYIDRTALDYLKPEIRERWMYLQIHKTR